MSENNNNTIKILIAIIISLSMVIVFSGIFYILNMQSKIEDLEQKQEEQLKQQWEASYVALNENNNYKLQIYLLLKLHNHKLI